MEHIPAQSDNSIKDLSPAAMKGLLQYFRRNHHLPLRTIVAISAICAGFLVIYLLSFYVLDWLLSDIPHGNGTDLARIASNFLGVVLMIAAIVLGWRKMKEIEAKELATFVVQLQAQGRPPHCFACGYDLKGSVADHCPECGEKLPWLGEPVAQSDQAQVHS